LGEHAGAAGCWLGACEREAAAIVRMKMRAKKIEKNAASESGACLDCIPKRFDAKPSAHD